MGEVAVHNLYWFSVRDYLTSRLHFNEFQSSLSGWLSVSLLMEDDEWLPVHLFLFDWFVFFHLWSWLYLSPWILVAFALPVLSSTLVVSGVSDWSRGLAASQSQPTHWHLQLISVTFKGSFVRVTLVWSDKTVRFLRSKLPHASMLVKSMPTRNSHGISEYSKN